MKDKIDQRLVTYGTLAPGRVNHHQLDGLQGRWHKGKVKGQLHEAGWGAAHGYPGITLHPDGPPVDVFIFESSDLPNHWDRLDAFEGSGYRRVVASVETDEGQIEGWIYEILP